MLTDGQLAAIQARCQAVPPGPWTWEDWTQDDGPNRNTLQYVRPFADDFERRLWGQRFGGKPVAIIHSEGSDCPDEVREFLAHAREDVPALLAEVDRLRAVVACQHEKVFDGICLTSYPAQYPWTCRLCGYRGVDVDSIPNR